MHIANFWRWRAGKHSTNNEVAREEGLDRSGVQPSWIPLENT
jgi:hypothetical protein